MVGVVLFGLLLIVVYLLKTRREMILPESEAIELIMEEHKIHNMNIPFDKKSELMKSRRVRVSRFVKKIEDDIASQKSSVNMF